jgi:hypothetical protein
MFFGPPLWPSGQSSWLQIQRSRFDSRRYQILWPALGLERVPLSLVSTTEELLGRKSRGSSLEIREYGLRDPSRWPRGTLYTQNLALTSSTSGSRSVGIVRSRTQAKEFLSCSLSYWYPVFSVNIITFLLRLCYTFYILLLWPPDDGPNRLKHVAKTK